jgi:hypothetical protein
MAEERVEMDLLSDLILITKNKTEGLAKRKFRKLRETIDLVNVTNAIREPGAIRLKTRNDDIVLRMNDRAEEAVATINQLIQELMLLKVRRFSTL